MIASPFASPLFAPMAIALAALLAMFLVAIAISHRVRVAEIRRSVLFRRWKVWAIIAPVFSLAALAGTVPLATLIAVIASIGAWEYGRLTGISGWHTLVLVAAASITPFLALSTQSTLLTAASVGVLAATGIPLVIRNDGHAVRSVAFMLLGLGWVAWLPAHVVLLAKDGPHGVAIVLALGLGVALSDVGAFVVGRAWGRRKLAPKISPNKTVEGLIGNVAGAYAGFLIVAGLLQLDPGLPVLLGAPAVIALGCVWGDLAESALKREFGRKDSGAWLPGFGGLLDRVDSLLIAAPLLFHFLREVA
ncbi:MAG: phosphatidate cytidylyltransferase [Chloroflexi bacterium]|nr:phosphatidate cytidylyltransferase [Chloroflexota bacterium]